MALDFMGLLFCGQITDEMGEIGEGGGRFWIGNIWKGDGGHNRTKGGGRFTPGSIRLDFAPFTNEIAAVKVGIDYYDFIGRNLAYFC